MELRPDERIVWRSVGQEIHAGAVSFTPIGPAATRVWVRLEWAPGVLREQDASGFDNMQVRNDLRRFKELIESEYAPEK